MYHGKNDNVACDDVSKLQAGSPYLVLSNWPEVHMSPSPQYVTPPCTGMDRYIMKRSD
jgi:hypothetical protein